MASTATVASPADATPARQPRAALPALIERENRRHTRRTAAVWLLVAALPLLAVAGYFAFRPRPVPLAQRFRAQAASVGDVVREVHATGRVEAQSTVTVGAEISGRVADVLVDFNATVHQGQILARFDRAALAAQLGQIEGSLAAARAALAQAESDVEQARINRARTERLYRAQVSTDAEHDNAEFALRTAEGRVRTASAQVQAQQAAHTLARTNLDHTVIRAPIDGVVISRNVDPGQTVVAALQTPSLFVVAADLRRMRVIANVDEADIGEVRAGQRAAFTVNAFPDRVFAGVVTEVRNSPQIVQDVVTYATVVEVPNDDLALRPGMTASVRVGTGSVERTLRVPNTALHFAPPGERTASSAAGVWVLEGTGTARALRRVEVRTRLTDSTFTAIEPGPLAAGTPVLVELTPEGRRAYGIAVAH